MVPMTKFVAKCLVAIGTITAWGSACCSADDLPGTQLAFVRQYCTDCHDASVNAGALDLTALGYDLRQPETLRRWVRVYDRLDAGEMPPKRAPQPDASAKRTFLSALGPALAAADRTQREVVYRRLNRNEYENTIRDLFGVRAEVAGILPEDAKAHGFDNIGEALAASTELIEGYLRAADVAIDMVLSQDRPPPRITKHSSFTDAFKTRANANLVFRFLDEGVVHYLS